MKFKGTKGKWYSKVTRSSNINGDESVVVFSENDNSSIDKGVCRLTTLNYDQNLVQEELEMKYNALLISKSPEMLAMLNILLHDYKNYIQNILQDSHRNNRINEIEQLIKQVTEL